MTRKKVAIFGSEGMVGTAVSHHLADVGMDVKNLPRSVYEIGRDHVDSLDLTNFDFVINAAGMINRPAREALSEAAFIQVNTTFPHDLARHCSKAKARLIHISTDCVFDGADGAYDEASPTNGMGIYSQTKQAGEPNEANEAMVLRMSMVGPERKNYYSLLCWFLAQDQSCNGFTDHLWNGLTTMAVARMMARIIDADLYVTGTRHVLTQDISKYNLLLAFRDVFSHSIDISLTVSAKPRDMRLRTQYPDFLASLNLPPLAEQIAELSTYSDARGHWKPPY